MRIQSAICTALFLLAGALRGFGANPRLVLALIALGMVWGVALSLRQLRLRREAELNDAPYTRSSE